MAKWIYLVDRLTRLLEAALFAASRPLTLDELRRLDPDAVEAEVVAALDALQLRYDEGGHGVALVALAGTGRAQQKAEPLPPGVTPQMIKDGQGIFQGAGLCSA